MLRPCLPSDLSMSPLRCLAYLSVVLHLLGLVLSGLYLSPGTPLAPLESRLRYLAETPGFWVATWCVWFLCAATLLAFLGRIATNEVADSVLAKIGVAFAIAAFGFDLACDSIFIAVFPGLAANASDPTIFLLVERITGIVSLTVANGLYTIGVVCVSEAIPRERSIRGTRELGWGVGLFGGLMAGAGITGNPWHAAIATGPTMLVFCAWTVLAARSLERAEMPR